MMSNLERLVYMANQIARAFDALGHDAAVAATAEHIIAFWDPRMRAQLVNTLENAPDHLSAVTREAAFLVGGSR